MEMQIILLLAVAGVLGVMFSEGYRKGFIRIVLSVAMTLVSFILAMLLSKPCEDFIKNNTHIYDKINTQMEEYISKHIKEEVNFKSEQLQGEAIKELKLPKTIQDRLISDNNPDVKLNLGADTFTEYLAKSLTDMLIESRSVIVLFVLLKVILRIVVMVLDIVSKLPVINGLNKSLGGAVGIVEGILIIWGACIFLTAASGTEIGQKIFSAISSNKVLSFIYNKNVLLNFMKNIK